MTTLQELNNYSGIVNIYNPRVRRDIYTGCTLGQGA